MNYLSVASRVISVHSNLYGDLSAPWIILEIWKCPGMSQNFAVIGIRGIFKNLIILGNYGLRGLSKTGSAVMMNDDDDIYIMVKCLSVCLSVTKNDHFL